MITVGKSEHHRHSAPFCRSSLEFCPTWKLQKIRLSGVLGVLQVKRCFVVSTGREASITLCTDSRHRHSGCERAPRSARSAFVHRVFSKGTKFENFIKACRDFLNEVQTGLRLKKDNVLTLKPRLFIYNLTRDLCVYTITIHKIKLLYFFHVFYIFFISLFS